MSKVPEHENVLRFPSERRTLAMTARQRGKPQSPARVRRRPVRRDAEPPLEGDDDTAEPIGPGAGEGGKP